MWEKICEVKWNEKEGKQNREGLRTLGKRRKKGESECEEVKMWEEIYEKCKMKNIRE